MSDNKMPDEIWVEKASSATNTICFIPTIATRGGSTWWGDLLTKEKADKEDKDE